LEWLAQGPHCGYPTPFGTLLESFLRNQLLTTADGGPKDDHPVEAASPPSGGPRRLFFAEGNSPNLRGGGGGLRSPLRTPGRRPFSQGALQSAPRLRSSNSATISRWKKDGLGNKRLRSPGTPPAPHATRPCSLQHYCPRRCSTRRSKVCTDIPAGTRRAVCLPPCATFNTPPPPPRRSPRSQGARVSRQPRSARLPSTIG
jgi:hypothetical protein